MSVLGNAGEPHNSRHACAACKHQRKKCEHDCIFAPHYPAGRANYFREVHKIFGVKNMTHMLEHLSPADRKSAVESLEWEALTWKEDPANGPLGALRKMEKEIELLRNQPMINNNNSIQQQFVVPYQTKSDLIGFNHNSAGIVASSSNFTATNFGSYVDTSQNLSFGGTMNNYGGFLARGEVENQMPDYPVPYYNSIPQGQGRSIQDIVAPTANILPKPETQRNDQTLDPVNISRPLASFNQANHQRGGHQTRFQGSFSGSQVQGRSTLPRN